MLFFANNQTKTCRSDIKDKYGENSTSLTSSICPFNIIRGFNFGDEFDNGTNLSFLVGSNVDDKTLL